MVRLKTKQNDLEKLYKIAHGRKAMVTIKKKVLLNLLMDHSRMFDALVNECDVVVKERVKQVSRVMLTRE